jgi:subtilisin family serine protease
MRRGAAAMLVLAAAAVAAPAPAGAAGVVERQLIVGFSDTTSHERATALVAKAGGSIRRRLDGVGALVVRPHTGLVTSALRARLREARGVRYAEPDYLVATSDAVPDDPYYSRQSALQSSPNGISAPQAWATRTSCSLVAVLDSGTQYDHPDLKQNIWHNSKEKAGNGKDDDHNGYVDDYYGFNAEKGTGSGGDADGHGTHVAGIIGAKADNATGVSGACWTAKIMPVRFMNSKGKGATSDAVAGMAYAVHMHAKVINCSFGSSSKSSALEDEIAHAKSAGVLLVVAAGNDGESIESHPAYPAASTYGNILTVAATTSTGALASFSNFGSKSVDLAAPGDDIYSTYPTSAYKSLSGTSMAAPFVAGAAAMLRSQNSELTYSQLRTALKESVVADPALSGKTVTGGRLDLARALAQAHR